jgi:hypothetical protein
LSVGAILLQADSFLLDEEFMVKIGRPVNWMAERDRYSWERYENDVWERSCAPTQ